MMRRSEVVAVLAVLGTLLLLSHSTQAVSVRSRENDASPKHREQRELDGIPDWFWSKMESFNRMRKGHQIDAGFLSRHNAISNYLNAYDAHQEAINPYGPGRRK